MARRVEVMLEDDLDGSEAEHTVAFSLDGVDYEIDLSDDNATQLRETLAGYVEHARRITKSGQVVRRVKVGSDAKTIRAWAQARGLDVPARGRIPRSVVEQFEAAH